MTDKTLSEELCDWLQWLQWLQNNGGNPIEQIRVKRWAERAVELETECDALRRALHEEYLADKKPPSQSAGCGDSSCLIQKPTGMATNGGCRCTRPAFKAAFLSMRAERDRLAAEMAELKDRFVSEDGTMLRYSEWIMLPRDSDRIAENERLRQAVERIDDASDESFEIIRLLRGAIKGNDKVNPYRYRIEGTIGDGCWALVLESDEPISLSVHSPILVNLKAIRYIDGETILWTRDLG